MSVKGYLNPVEQEEWETCYGRLLKCIRDNTFTVETLLQIYNERFQHLAIYYDQATKLSTLVNENYEKLEECVEVARTEICDLLKKLCSFTTLEMDYYEKLLGVWNDGSDHNPTSNSNPSYKHAHVFYKDYEHYRVRLNQIHRYDQVRLFGDAVSALLSTLMHIVTKFHSILDNDDNISEIKKLWTKEDRFRY
jgi:hypothetical protein